MQELAPWITPALLVVLVAWVRFDLRQLRRDLHAGIKDSAATLDKRIDDLARGLDTRFDDFTRSIDARFDQVDARFDRVDKRLDQVDKRLDQVNRELADQRERMAKLEGSLDGFLAGRRDRSAA